MMARAYELTHYTARIVAFGGDEHPVDVIETTEVAYKECFGVGRAYYNDAGNTGFTSRMDGVDKILKCKVIRICVAEVVVISKDSIVIALQSLYNLCMLLHGEMCHRELCIFYHNLCGIIDKGIYTKTFLEHLAQHVGKDVVCSSE